jgi:hypothetical protein
LSFRQSLTQEHSCAQARKETVGDTKTFRQHL